MPILEVYIHSYTIHIHDLPLVHMYYHIVLSIIIVVAIHILYSSVGLHIDSYCLCVSAFFSAFLSLYSHVSKIFLPLFVSISVFVVQIVYSVSVLVLVPMLTHLSVVNVQYHYVPIPTVVGTFSYCIISVLMCMGVSVIKSVLFIFCFDGGYFWSVFVLLVLWLKDDFMVKIIFNNIYVNIFIIISSVMLLDLVVWW